MDAGNRKEEDHGLGATLPAPSAPRLRPLRYHTRPSHQQDYYPFGPKHENPHDHTHQREPALPGQISLDGPQLHRHHHLPTAATISISALSNAPLTATAASESPSSSPSTTLHDGLFESRAANNQNATHANAVLSIEPNGFYHNHLDHLMASTLPVPRQSQDALQRSNEISSVSRHPAIALSRSGVKPSLRSVSAPVEDGASTGTARSRATAPNTWNPRSGHKPSVKDLKKKFDQKAPQTSTSAVRRPPPHMPARGAQWSEANGPPPHPYAAGRSSVTRDHPTGAPGTSSVEPQSTQQNRTVPDDNLSGNAHSFASRIAKPRSPIGIHSQASKSMTSLAQLHSKTPVPQLPQTRELLFGEVGRAELGAGVAGHGIDGIPARRTSESNLHEALARRQRSFSHTDAEPSSPSDWYRGLSGVSRGADDVGVNRSYSTSHHGRSRSDTRRANSVQEQPTAPLSRRPKPTLDTLAVTSASRIPISVRKYTTPSCSSSPTSTRSNSPSTVRKPFGQGKKWNTNQKLGSNIPSPLASPATAKRQRRPSTITSNNNTKLNAYISVPPPKLSPPLRSSRPRQAVSVATTISSRVKAIERNKSPGKKDGRVNVSGNEPATRRKKIPMGPIDYESRRERIKLSYNRSLQENEARAATKRILQNKSKEESKKLADQIAAIKTPEEPEDIPIEPIEPIESINGAAQIPAAADNSASEPSEPQMITPGLTAESSADAELTTPDPTQNLPQNLPPLQTIISQILHSEDPTASICTSQEETALPKLGLPGSLPCVERSGDQDEAPPSAISNITQFDDEPQTEPPMRESPLLKVAHRNSGSNDDNHQLFNQTSQSQSACDESADDDGLSIQIALDTSIISAVALAEHSESTYDNFSTSQEAPSIDPEETSEFRPLNSPSNETKVTILGHDAIFTTPVAETHILSSSTPASEQQLPEHKNEQDHASTTLQTFLNSEYVQSGVNQPEPTSGLDGVAEASVSPLLLGHQQRSQNFDAPHSDAGVEPGVDASRAQQDAEDPRYSLDSKKTLETRPSLTVPRTSESMNRSSQTSVWTDFSMNSQDSSSGYRLTDRDSQRVGFTWREYLAGSETGSRSESCRYSRNSLVASYSRAVSPCGTYREPELYPPRDRLPEIDAGVGFAEGILSRKNSMDSLVVPVLPNHSPPHLPPETSSFHDMTSSTSPSECCGETRPSSYLHNETDGQSVFSAGPLGRGSDYFGPSQLPSRSNDQQSLAISDGHQSNVSQFAAQSTLVESSNVEPEPELPAKEKKRLFTRLEIIKELVDTETFFIRDMNIVEEIYKGTAEACPKLDDKTIKLIFRNTDKIIQFHSAFLLELKQGVSSIYTPRVHRPVQKDTSSSSDRAPSLLGVSTSASGQLSDEKDRETSLGPIFIRNMENMKQIHEAFLKNSDHAAKRLIQIQEDPTVQVWLNECNEVARELTRAWNLDSLLIKPMQRITKYPNLLIQLLHETPIDHPDRPSLEAARTALESSIEEINKTKKNFELVGQIVGRRRKESDVKAGFARAFGKRVDKLQAANNRPDEDTEYLKLHEKFGDDYLRLQVVLRDVEYYARQVSDHVHEFLQYLSSMELVMRLQASPHPEIESKWVQFNVSMRDIEKVALEQHLSQVRKQVIEPFELVIKSYSNPSLAMKKRSKRRIDYEKYIQLQKSGKRIDKQLSELVEQYEALNEALKKELPKLSALTEQVGNICLANFVNIQAQWFSIWKKNIGLFFGDTPVPALSDIVSTFLREFKFQDEQINMIGIVNPASKGRSSHSTSIDDASSRFRARPVEPSEPRLRGLSLSSDIAPSLPTPDFMKRHSGQFATSPSVTSMSSNQFYRDYYIGANGSSRQLPESPKAPEFPQGSRSLATRPGTGQSHDSGRPTRRSVESRSQSRGHSSSVQRSPYQAPDSHRFSGLFQSALPMSDAHERHARQSQVSSRASSRERQSGNGYNILWLAASLFEFNIETTKHEAGYPYLTYQAGEIFDVIAEKGELWLAKNQDDPKNLVGWLWSKHFAKLADD
ncbi:hypothetical protein GGS21DRAFT_234084 [Xylaria nigripes]|nr:hypothetical protein GGS21DRAFT_234084 [Xylaria nigripes]